MYHLVRIKQAIQRVDNKTECVHFSSLLNNNLMTESDTISFMETIAQTFTDCFHQDTTNSIVHSTFYLTCFILCSIGCILAIFNQEIKWFDILRKLFFLSFIGGLIWNYHYVYYVAIARKHAVVTNGGCSNSFSILRTLTAIGNLLFSTTPVYNECEREMIAIYVDALWETSPSYVFCITFTRLFVDPIKVCAESTNEIIRHLFSHLPVIYIPLIMGSILYIISLIVMVRYQYLISVPFLLTLSPSRHSLPRYSKLRVLNKGNAIRRTYRRP